MGLMFPMLSHCGSNCPLEVIEACESVEQLLASINSEGFPLELLVRAANASRGGGSGGGRRLEADEAAALAELLELPHVRAAAQSVALRVAAQRLLNTPASARALLMFNWADRGLCAYPWLSWLPWLACQGQGTRYEEFDDQETPLLMDEALPVGECYSDSDQ